MDHIKIVLRVSIAVFIVELVIMYAPSWIPHDILAGFSANGEFSLVGIETSPWWPLIDTVLLVLIVGPVVYFGAIRAFTLARDRAEENLLQFKMILDLSPDQVYINHPDTLQFLYMNKAAQLNFGWAEKEYLNKSLHDIHRKFDEARFRKEIAPLIQGSKKSNTFETKGIKQEPIEITQQMIHFLNKEPWFVSIVRDITQRKLAENAKADFIATVTHELRTPLTSIKGSLGLIKGGAFKDDPAKLMRLAGMAYANSDRLGLLINDILDIEKLNAGMVEFQIGPVDLSHLVNEAVSANEGYAVELGVSFNTTGVDIPVFVAGDANRLMQVMANLMSNAAKYSKEGCQIEVSLALKGSNARISVKDNGPGIPEDARKNIFKKFTQVGSSDHRAKGGTGLGLNIAKLIVKRHKGTIDFVSEPDSGTTFFLAQFALSMHIA